MPHGRRRRARGGRTATTSSFAVPNLYSVDGSVLPTQGSANPALTIMALAARCARITSIAGQHGAGCSGVIAVTAGTVSHRLVDAEAYEIPTDQPEADGTLAWDSTAMVVVKARAADEQGIGWTYAGAGGQDRDRRQPCRVVIGGDILAVPALHEAMVRACRNLGRPGLAACAISAVDIALWDLKARTSSLSLVRPLRHGPSTTCPIYGSGGFTTYDDATTARATRSTGSTTGDPPGQDQDRRVLGRRARPRPRPGGTGPARSSATRRAVRRRQRRLHSASRPSASAGAMTETTGSAGSRSRCRPTTSPGCGRSATSATPTSPPASTATPPSTSPG